MYLSVSICQSFYRHIQNCQERKRETREDWVGEGGRETEREWGRGEGRVISEEQKRPARKDEGVGEYELNV